MIRGINPLSLDGKGRMAMPARHREHLQERCAGQLIVTIDRGPCLLIYPLPEWEVVEQALIRLSSTERQARNLKRLLIGHAQDCEMDGQGRILLSAPLREYAHLDRRVMLVGQGNKFELWDEQNWYRLREEMLKEDPGEGPLSAELESLSF